LEIGLQVQPIYCWKYAHLFEEYPKFLNLYDQGLIRGHSSEFSSKKWAKYSELFGVSSVMINYLNLSTQDEFTRAG